MRPLFQAFPPNNHSSPAIQIPAQFQMTVPVSHRYAGAPLTSPIYLQFVQLVQSALSFCQFTLDKNMGNQGYPTEMDLKLPAPHVSHVAAVRPSAEL